MKIIIVHAMEAAFDLQGSADLNIRFCSLKNYSTASIIQKQNAKNAKPQYLKPNFFTHLNAFFANKIKYTTLIQINFHAVQKA